MIKNGVEKNCLTCGKSFYVAKWNVEKAKYCSRECKNTRIVQFCPKGHDTLRVGRKNGMCIECKKEYIKKWNEEHREERKEEYEINKDSINAIRKAEYPLKREQILAAAKKYREEHRDEINAKQKPYHREYNLKSKYGITPQDYDRMFEDQKGLCLGCNLNKVLVVDHDHKTGKVRGLLCDGCNRGIGYLKENIETFKRLIFYIEKHKINEELLAALKELSLPL